MGAWGMHAFDNDRALDYLDELTKPEFIQELLSDPEKVYYDPADILHAAGEVIAAARTGVSGLDSGPDSGLYQSQTTGLFDMILSNLDPKQARAELAEALGGEVYLPEEIVAALPGLQFSDETRDKAAHLIREYCLSDGDLASWSDSDERRRCVEATISRLQAS